MPSQTPPSSTNDRSERELMLANEMYAPTDPELQKMHMQVRELMHAYNNSAPKDNDGRHKILKELLGGMGDAVEIRAPFFCDYGKHIYLGSTVFMNYNCVILDCNEVRIGDNVMFGPYVQVYTAYHPLEAGPRNSGRELAAPITIEDNVWLGGGAIICPDVTIGKNSVIGAGAVVTKSVPANVFAGGNPCKVIKEIENPTN